MKFSIGAYLTRLERMEIERSVDGNLNRLFHPFTSLTSALTSLSQPYSEKMRSDVNRLLPKLNFVTLNVVKGLPSRCKCEILRYTQNDIFGINHRAESPSSGIRNRAGSLSVLWTTRVARIPGRSRRC